VTAVKVSGDRRGLGHLVRNLVDNAARHAVSRVVMTVDAAAGAPVLLVDDDGPGILAAGRARVFERFTRRSAGRSRDTGLGLALVKRIADQHGASVRADRAPTGGARLEVRFPTAAG
jgi:signal transduction histidine kinase